MTSSQNRSSAKPTQQTLARETSTSASVLTAPVKAGVVRRTNFSGWIMLPLRLFLGITFVYAGIQKLTDPEFFQSAAPGYIGKQIVGFANGSPLHDLLLNVALPHAVFFGYAIAIGEIAIGLGVLVGFLFRPAAFFGLLLSLTFFLSASFHIYPYFFGSDIVFVFCWLTLLLNGPTQTGYPALDNWVANSFAPGEIKTLSDKIARVACLLLVARPGEGQTLVVESDMRQGSISGMGNRGQQRGGNTQWRGKEARRNFLLGAFSGGGVILGLGVILGFVRTFGQGGAGVKLSTTPTPTTTDTAVSKSIAKTSQVAKNSAVTFTLPATETDGVLIHLADDQFVAFDATCTHSGCEVSYDETSQHLVCPCHHSTFDPAQDAAVLRGPAKEPLKKLTLRIDGATGEIFLQ